MNIITFVVQFWMGSSCLGFKVDFNYAFTVISGPGCGPMLMSTNKTNTCPSMHIRPKQFHLQFSSVHYLSNL